MPRVPWFLVFAIVLQLCLGSACARPTEVPAEQGAPVEAASAIPAVHAHCHEAVQAPEPDAAAGTADVHNRPAGHCCCGATHCPLCSAVGLPFQTLASAPLPNLPHTGRLTPVVLSLARPPELRPPI